MPVRKPISVEEEPITSFDDITPEFLEEKERTWEDVRMKELTIDSLKKAGEELSESRSRYERAESECKIRAIRAASFGYDKKELAEAMGVSTRTITAWTKGEQ